MAPPLVAAWLLLVIVIAVVAGARAVAAESGSVSGSITATRASLRSGGPKHDLDVVVSVTPLDGAALPPADSRTSMDQKGLVFVPHVLAVEKGTTVTFLNSDNDQHNVYFLDDESGETLDIGTWGPGVSVDHRFDEPGLMITLCKLHLEMAAYVVVLDSPWFTTVELDPDSQTGGFTLDGIPPGEYELVAWHKKLRQQGGAMRLTVTAGGRTEVTVTLTSARYASAGRAGPGSGVTGSGVTGSGVTGSEMTTGEE